MKRQLYKLTFITLTCFIGLSSCSTIFSGIYGIKKIKTVDENTILRYSKKYNIPLADSYELDTAYNAFLNSLDTTKYKTQINNHNQPLQALYYGKTRKLLSFQVNCYAGGFPNLNWDRNEIMSSFPPKHQSTLDSIVPFETQLKYMKPLSKTEGFIESSYDYVIIVYWNRFMGRQSKRLIQLVQNNSELVTDKKVKIIYANTDNIFAINEVQLKL
tara:strand:+ start:521 stop:1165 length:645 start_codon:yes stop_codon:yes gene_type:complete